MLFCSIKCYGNWQKGKSFTDQEKKTRPKKQCVIDGCLGKHFGKGFCKTHYSSFVERAIPKDSKKTNHQCARCGVKYFDPRTVSKYCSRACSAADHKSPFIIKKGYKKILVPDHPRADGKGYVFEHIIIVEAKVGRAVLKGEEVHHSDMNKLNNHPENLILCKSHAEHIRYHHG